MTITVKFVTQRSGGRVTVRPHDVTKTEILIGRSTECDAHLPDLRVGLQHARLILASGGAVIESVGERPVKVNGKVVQRAHLQIGENAEIRVGPYRLTLEPGDAGKPGEDGAALTVAIELVDPVTTAHRPEDEQRIFHVGSVLPGKRRMAWIAVAAILVVFLAWPLTQAFRPADARPATPGFAPDQLWLSGGMSLAHANLSDSCTACHQAPFVAVKDKVCLSCHLETRNHADPAVLARAAPQSSAFGSMLTAVQHTFGLEEERCGSCHKEHNGAQGVVPVDQKLCTDCHRDMDTRHQETALINVSDFKANHPEFRPTVVIEPGGLRPRFERIALNETPKENSGVKFPHDTHLEEGGAVSRMVRDLRPLYGAQTELSCENCHVADAGGVLFQPIRMEEHCSACHSLAFDKEEGRERLLPHGQPQEVIAVVRDFYLAKALETVAVEPQPAATRRRPGRGYELRENDRRQAAFENAQGRTLAKVREVFSDGGACHDCHDVAQPDDPQSLAFDIRPVALTDRFLPKGKFTHASHLTSNLSCVTCHEAPTSKVSSDVLLPGIDSCRECHGGEHATAAIPSPCVTCHEYHADDHAPLMAFKSLMSGGAE